MAGGGPGSLRSHECTEFITPGAQMVSGRLSQVQVHVQETLTDTHTRMQEQSEGETEKEREKVQTDRRC